MLIAVGPFGWSGLRWSTVTDSYVFLRLMSTGMVLASGMEFPFPVLSVVPASDPMLLVHLRQHSADHPAVHVRQPPVDAVVTDRQAGVVDAQEVQDRGVDVVGVSGVV